MTEWTDGADIEGADVVVIGGGAAGLNGALMLARARRAVVVIDAGTPRNAPAGGVHGLLGREGTPPRRAARTGPGRGPGYGGKVMDGAVTTAARDGDGFVEYLCQSRAGLRNQGWKDSEDCIVNADGTLATGSIALAEVQGYVYLAKMRISEVYEALGERGRAGRVHPVVDRVRPGSGRSEVAQDLAAAEGERLGA